MKESAAHKGIRLARLQKQLKALDTELLAAGIISATAKERLIYGPPLAADTQVHFNITVLYLDPSKANPTWKNVKGFGLFPGGSYAAYKHGEYYVAVLGHEDYARACTVAQASHMFKVTTAGDFRVLHDLAFFGKLAHEHNAFRRFRSKVW